MSPTERVGPGWCVTRLRVPGWGVTSELLKYGLSVLPKEYLRAIFQVECN